MRRKHKVLINAFTFGHMQKKIVLPPSQKYTFISVSWRDKFWTNSFCIRDNKLL